MFTGLVQAIGRVQSSNPTPTGVRFAVDFGTWAHTPSLGDSISISGCCLTVAAIDGRTVSFDIVPETLAKTSLGSLRPASPVNLEHSVTPTTLMGGHIVQGHVDAVATVESVQTTNEWRIRIRPPAAILPYLAPKGSICVEGVSLTIAELDTTQGWFEVALIPTTLAQTTLRDLKSGSTVNLEADMIAKQIVHYLRHFSPTPASSE